MANGTGNAPGDDIGHCLNKTTTDRLPVHLDTAKELEIEVVDIQFVGGRDWVIITYGAWIPGLAGRRVFT